MSLWIRQPLMFKTCSLECILFVSNLQNIIAHQMLDCVWNVMALAQKPDFVFRRNRRVHVNRQGRQFSRLLAAELCASAIVMLDIPSSEVVKGIGCTLHSPVSPKLPLPCVPVCHHVSTGLYHVKWLYLFICLFNNANIGSDLFPQIMEW
jgi:hypothetical protein